MLFRASAFAVDGSTPEITAFLEAATQEAAAKRLVQLLALVWDCAAENVDFYNLFSEHDLRRHAVSAGHARYLENGWDGREPTYAEPLRTCLLVGPAWLADLTRAQRALAHPTKETA